MYHSCGSFIDVRLLSVVAVHFSYFWSFLVIGILTVISVGSHPPIFLTVVHHFPYQAKFQQQTGVTLESSTLMNTDHIGKQMVPCKYNGPILYLASEHVQQTEELIRVFVVRMKKLCILGYPICAQWRFCANQTARVHFLRFCITLKNLCKIHRTCFEPNAYA